MSSLLSATDSQKISSVVDEPAAAETLDGLELTIELGHTRLTLAEVQLLRPGAMISLEEYMNDPVTLFAGSKLVGRGEMLLIEGQLGVRITELYPA